MRIPIAGTVAPYATITPVPTAWEFNLEGQFREATQDYEFKDSGYTAGRYHVLVFANTSLVLSLEGGEVTVGGRSYAPIYRWALAAGSPGRLLGETHAAPGPTTLYHSGGPVTSGRINLVGFQIVEADPVLSGALTGELTVTISSP